jgi:hypothetical protein
LADGTIESGPLGLCDCVPERGAAVELTGPSAVAWSVWIVTVRIFFGAGAADRPAVGDEPDSVAEDDAAGAVLAAGFGAVAVVIAGALGGSVEAALFDGGRFDGGRLAE